MVRCRSTCVCPKLRGFKNPFRTEYQVVNLDKLSALYPEGGSVTVEDLVAKGAVRKGEPVKVLGTGEITVKLEVAVDALSAFRQGQDPCGRWLHLGGLIRRTGPIALCAVGPVCV